MTTTPLASPALSRGEDTLAAAARDTAGATDVSQAVGSVADFLGVDLSQLAQQLAQVVLILLACWVAYRLLRLLTRRIELAVDDGDPTTLTEREQRGRTLAQLLNNVGAVVIAVVGVLMALNIFIDIGPLLAGAGIVGLAISFGAQSLVKDVIAGFFILLENQFAVGDIVQVGEAAGVVERMTLRVVMLRDVNGVLHIVPNGQIAVVSNRTRHWSRTVLDVGVAYKENVDRVIDVIKDVARKMYGDPAWSDRFQAEPEVWGVEALADSSVNIRVVAQVMPGKQFEVARELRRRLKNRFDSEGIEIPFPQRTLHVATAAALERMPIPRA